MWYIKNDGVTVPGSFVWFLSAWIHKKKHNYNGKIFLS